MDMAVEVAAEPVHEGHGAEPGAARRIWAVLLVTIEADGIRLVTRPASAPLVD